ncbi:MAG: ABC transporter permease, partial [Gemmatimonadaceae bacterium]
MRRPLISTRWRKVLADLRLHKARTALVVVAIVVGLAGAGSVLDAWSLMRQVTREEYRASRPPSATLRVDSLGSLAAAQLRKMPTIAAIQMRRTVSGNVRVSGDPTPRALVVFSMADFDSKNIGRLARETGAWPPADDAIVIERSSVDFAGAHIGDSVAAQVGESQTVTLPITGIARDVGLPPGWMEHVVYTFVAPSTLPRLGAPSWFNEVQFVVRDNTSDRAAIRRVAADAKRNIERAGGTVTNIDVPVPGEHMHAAQINSLLYTQGAFGAIALLLSGILVINLIAAMLTGQTREIGVMKAIGATPRQVASMYLALALVLGVFASLIAIPLAALIGRAYANFTADILNFSTTGFEIPRGAFVLQLAVGLLFPVLAAAIPVSHGCRISVGEALRDVGIANVNGSGTSEPILNASTRLSGVSRPLLLSLRNAFRKRQRMLLTLLTLATGGATFIGALNLKESVRGAVDLLFSAQRYDIALRLARAADPDSLERLTRTIQGVAASEAWGAARGTPHLPDSTTGDAFPIVALTPKTERLGHALVEGRWLRDGDDNALVVNKRLFTDDSALHVGAIVPITVAGKTLPWTIVGVVETGVSPTAYATRSAIASLTGDTRVDRIVISSSLRDAPSQLDLMQRLRSGLADQGQTVQSGQLMTESRQVMEDHLVMVAGFLGVMGQLMIVVGGLALASTMGLAVLERTREIGVLRAIGAKHGAIMTMIQVEGLVIGLLGWALAIPLSLPMSVALGRAFGRIMIPLAITYLPAASGVA